MNTYHVSFAYNYSFDGMWYLDDLEHNAPNLTGDEIINIKKVAAAYKGVDKLSVVIISIIKLEN